jgi:predicted nuclease of predicted toxin-antitoxin system
MRILIDECLDWRLCRSLIDHTCTSVQKMGWSGLTNGDLLERAEKEFDVFLTGDRNLTFQQKTSSFEIAVVVLHAESIQLRHTLPLMPKVLALLPVIESGQVVNVSD